MPLAQCPHILQIQGGTFGRALLRPRSPLKESCRTKISLSAPEGVWLTAAQLKTKLYGSQHETEKTTPVTAMLAEKTQSPQENNVDMLSLSVGIEVIYRSYETLDICPDAGASFAPRKRQGSTLSVYRSPSPSRLEVLLSDVFVNYFVDQRDCFCLCVTIVCAMIRPSHRCSFCLGRM